MPEKLNKPRVLGVLAGCDLPLDRLAEWAGSADIILAADGAANALESCSLIPNTTIGDLDSISNSTKDRQAELIQIDDQNSSDCDKLLALAEMRGYEDITLIGAEGDLLDHVLGNLYSAARSKLKIRFALRRGLAHVIRGGESRQFQAPLGTRLSIIPLTSCSGVNLIGAEWPLTNAEISPLGLISLSNRTSDAVAVNLADGVAVVFLAHPDLERPVWP